MDAETTFRSYKPLLFSLAYNMLGSVMDAEDCVQEVFLRWHRAYNIGAAEAVRAPRAYLCAAITNLCIDHLRSARVRREAYVGVWLPEPLLTADPGEQAERAEILSMASLRLLEALSPVERAVFLLRQVFDYEYQEIADIVGKSAQNCRQIFHRARQRLLAQRREYTVSSEQHQQFLTSFIQASASGDMQLLLDMLASDVALYSDGGESLTPTHGAEAVARSLLAAIQRISSDTQWRWQPATINGRMGILFYAYNRLYAVLAFEFEQGRMQEIDIVVSQEKLRHLQSFTGR
jgi:RNA polymerase sigma-70 factor, ECF subfamily